MSEARRLLRSDELKALEIHHRTPGSVHACPPWIADRLAEARAFLAQPEPAAREAVADWEKYLTDEEREKLIRVDGTGKFWAVESPVLDEFARSLAASRVREAVYVAALQAQGERESELANSLVAIIEAEGYAPEAFKAKALQVAKAALSIREKARAAPGEPV